MNTQQKKTNDALPTFIRDRWQALIVSVDKLKAGTLLAHEEITSDERKLFKCHLDNLVSFTWRLLGYFSEKKPSRATQLTPAFAMNLVLNQATFDVTFIQQAIAQRIERGALLRKADKLADEFLQPAIKANLFADNSNVLPDINRRTEPKPVLLTYLQKASTLRMMPYSPIAFVSMPMTALACDHDENATKRAGQLAFLSLAHEIGHLVFWKGSHVVKNGDFPHDAKFASFLNRELLRRGFSSYLADGAEEIVADVYGALVVGLPILRTAQITADMHQRERYYAGSSRYMVTPELRPHVYEQALDCDKMYHSAAIGEAKDKWQEMLKVSHGTQTSLGDSVLPISVQVESGGYVVPYLRARNEIQQLVDNVVFHLLTEVNSDKIGSVGLLKPGAQAASTTPALPTADPVLDDAGAAVAKRLNETLKNPPDPTPYSPKVVWDKPEDGDVDYWERWSLRLQKEEAEQSAALEKMGFRGSNYADADIDWFTMLYSGGWVLESMGNLKGPK